jgi:rod shape-determining protein MreB
MKNRLHVNLVAALADGVVASVDATRDLMRHMRRVIDPSGHSEIRAVIGVPANAPQEARDNVRRAVAGVFDRVLLIPEPFLAALGVRDDARVGQANYVDPVNNSLFIDIGAGTTDLCLVHTPDRRRPDQFAGDAIDQLMLA